MAAMASFLKSEQSCAGTNARFRRLLDNHSLSALDLNMIEFLERAKWWIKETLGRLPNDLEGSFGPGATFRDKGQRATVADKIESPLSYTPGVECLLPFVTKTAWFRSLTYRQTSNVFDVVQGNRFTTVPKTAITDRGICIEPGVNIYLQKAVGSCIKSKILRRWGHDILHAQSKHQSLACVASRTGSHATIDLESASDTVSAALVKFLLPPEWYDLLLSLRSPITYVGGKRVVLEKFSSMGNGYTFELETIIFASLAHACGAGDYGDDFLVFGDDIIVRTEVASDLLELLQYCGFLPNKAKTHVTGPFRESCGGDFFNGHPVRGHNVEKEPTTPEDWISLANGLRRLGSRELGGDFRGSIAHTAWMRCLDALPVHIRRLRGPVSYGDLVINDDDGFQVKWRQQKRYLAVYRPIPKFVDTRHWKNHIVYAAVLYGIDRRGVPTRGVRGYKVGWINYP